jgi:hypothetical protein
MTHIIELSSNAAAYLILARVAWDCLTWAMLELDALIGDHNAD